MWTLKSTAPSHVQKATPSRLLLRMLAQGEAWACAKTPPALTLAEALLKVPMRNARGHFIKREERLMQAQALMDASCYGQ